MELHLTNVLCCLFSVALPFLAALVLRSLAIGSTTSQVMYGAGYHPELSLSVNSSSVAMYSGSPLRSAPVGKGRALIAF